VAAGKGRTCVYFHFHFGGHHRIRTLWLLLSSTKEIHDRCSSGETTAAVAVLLWFGAISFSIKNE
jgi:hypothetical protein